jgi:hypothetical protein
LQRFARQESRFQSCKFKLEKIPLRNGKKHFGNPKKYLTQSLRRRNSRTLHRHFNDTTKHHLTITPKTKKHRPKQNKSMKTLRKIRLPHLFAVVAAAGLSISAAYAVPSYQPDLDSPINLTGGAPSLAAGLSAIEALLPSGKTLINPSVNDVPAGVKPTATEFKLAVRAAAAAAATPADKAAIVQAALTIGANPLYAYPATKDIVRQVMTDFLGAPYSLSGAQTIMNAALNVNNGKTNDVMGGLILAIGDVGTSGQEQDADDLTAAAFNTMAALSGDTTSKTAALVEGLADAAIKNAKPNSLGTTGFASGSVTARVTDIAVALIDATEASPAPWLLDDVVKGIVKSAKVLVPATAGGLNLDALITTIATTVAQDDASQAHAFSGIMRVTKGTDLTGPQGINAVKAAFKAGSSLSDGAVEALANGYLTMGNTAPASRATALSQLLAGTPALNVTVTSDNAANLPFLAAGAAYFSAGLSKAIVTDIFTSPQGSAASNSIKMDVVAAISRAQSGGAAKAAGAAVAAAGGLSAADALAAALPNTTAANAGAVATEVTKAAPTTAASAITIAAINALTGAAGGNPENDFKAGIIDVTKSIVTLRKADAQTIANAGIAAAPASHRAAVAAALGAADNKVDHTSMLVTAAGLAGLTAPELVSIQTAERVARQAKTSTKTALTMAQDEMRAPGADVASVLLGAGVVNKLHVNVLLGGALRLGTSLTSGDKAQLLAHAQSLNKTGEADVRLAYDVATQVLASKDDLFDIVDNQTVINPKSVATIATAASAAAPEYAHFVARAAAFRSSPSTIAKVPAAIIQGADMNANLSSNPSAVAAIAAGFVHGIQDAKHSATLQPKVLAAGVTAMVKAAQITGDKGVLKISATTAASGNFRSVDIVSGAAPTGANQPEYGSAAATTGITSILTAPTDTLPNANLTAALTAIGKALGAGSAAKGSEILVAAQAAVQAFYFVTNSTTPVSGAAVTAIVNALKAGLSATAQATMNAKLVVAANAGLAEAQAGHMGAGAAGILNYAHFNVNNSPVTDISNF